ncbi:uncharacterized protein LOC126379148 isoform X2 [Pectinophora gossypiella]|uniref:uncharacterized protein LOC126379148 isoform X2 n=1 Tax=Pectinophora gossypiella TaxID=13191 RepID=UPI00214E2839|nr:uncharacterized protein LOC126379148 isoform X2 [Pectinophora gossypiella]
MFSSITYVLIWIFPTLFHSGTCFGEPIQPYLSMYTPGEVEYTDVLVRRVGDNLTLVCELKGDSLPTPRKYAWSYVPADNSTDDNSRPYYSEPRGPTLASRLTRLGLTLADSGHYFCNTPPYSIVKFILVQTRGPKQCARGAFWCGKHCVLPNYVCDGFKDCVRGEDEAPELCMHQPCSRPDKLNCSSGRCIPAGACCRTASLCQQPACCEEHPKYSRGEGYIDVEYPPLFEDRHAPDEYGFIQSTIYTVTACALIFMIAVVLLVSAICKMHMKRAALRSYTHAERATRQHYEHQYEQAHRFPPCYEASRLLEQQRAGLAPASPARAPLQCDTSCDAGGAEAAGGGEQGFGLARLSAIFSSRYRQVPTQCLDVEMTDVRSASCNTSPTRGRPRPRLDHYRSPTYCDLNTDLFFNPEVSNCGRELNYMATPMEFFRRRTLRNIDLRPRSLTLQLGRFQLSIPRLGRRQSLERRPDTPNVAELNIDDLDFVRLDGNETYTLNGRTIRLLGANFENYPGLNDATARPPPYTDAMRYKLYGPPPEYLSRDTLNNEREENTNNTEVQARRNVEMPPCYDELATPGDSNAEAANIVTDNVIQSPDTSNGNVVVAAVENNVINNTSHNVTNSNSHNVINNTSHNVINNAFHNYTNDVTNNTSHNIINNAPNNVTNNASHNVTSNVENLSSVIDNLPAIDSDINANETDTRYNVITCNVDNAVITNNNEC